MKNVNDDCVLCPLMQSSSSDRLITDLVQTSLLAVFAQQKSGMKGITGKVYCEVFSSLHNENNIKNGRRVMCNLQEIDKQ